MPAPPPIALIIFDLGGVMVRLADRWIHACARVGIECPPALADPAVIGAIRDHVDSSERGRLTNEQFDQEVGRLVGLAPEAIARISTAWLVAPYPGIEALVDRLAATGLQLGCLSNTNDRHWHLMTRPGNDASLPLDRFHHRFASHLLGLRKPEPAIYRHVEEQVGLDPAGILLLDDRPDNTAAAAARGWQTLVVDPKRPVQQITDHLTALGCLQP